ncbi:DUF502 domain-containing protein [Litorimonas sp. RW-G-Af-16]|uniref:DUF502 domain-containing protein n=1 Tax=Litorimonas sp. RW-G-Af-16 TaxID=3241168 RepID=UPI00390C4AB0
MNDLPDHAAEKPKPSIFRWVRNRLITGVIIALPILVVITVISWIVQLVDEKVIRFLPDVLNPRTYLGFDIPGLGLIIAIVLLFLLGIVASNFIGKSIIRAGEKLLARVPIVSPTYSAVKQIVTTVAEQKDRAFRDVCLIEYPRPGLWAVGFVTADLTGAPKEHLPENHVCVFVPTTPNPTSGFLLFTPRDRIKILNMTPEEGAKMIISGGMVSSNHVDEEIEPTFRERLGLLDKKPKSPKEPKPSL